MNKHILITDWSVPDFDIERAALQARGMTWSLPENYPSERDAQIAFQLERIQNEERIDGVLFALAPLPREVIEALPPECKAMQRVGIGLDNIDLDAAKERGISVDNTPDYAIEEVAVHAMAMLLSLHRQLDSTQNYLLEGHWRVMPPAPIERLSSLTLGLIGLGRIGRRFAEYMRPLVKEILFFDPAVQDAPDWARSVALDDVFSQSDLVSLHCPLLPQTRGIVNARTLALMKPTALLINVSRGALVEAEPLAAALRDGKLAGAALDVFEPEILPADSPLRTLHTTMHNVILTSHTAWYSRQSVIDCRTQAIEKLLNRIAA